MADAKAKDKELSDVYDAAFEKQSSKKSSQPGQAHAAGLRAVYDLGWRPLTRNA